MFVKQWEEKTSVSSISFQCTSFELTKKYMSFKNSKKQPAQALSKKYLACIPSERKSFCQLSQIDNFALNENENLFLDQKNTTFKE